MDACRWRAILTVRSAIGQHDSGSGIAHMSDDLGP